MQSTATHNLHRPTFAITLIGFLILLTGAGASRLTAQVATATAMASAWTSRPTNLDIRNATNSFRMRLCAALSSDSQRNPRHCEPGLEHSILTDLL